MLTASKNALNTFTNQHLDSGTRVIGCLILLNLLIGTAYNLINSLGTHYFGNNILPMSWIWIAPFMLGMVCTALAFAKDVNPRVGYFVYFLALYFFTTGALLIEANGVQFTPFAPIDPTLLHWDEILHVNTPALLSFTYHHYYFYKLLTFAYNALEPEIALLPFLMALLYCKKSTRVFLMAVLISFPIGTLLYYFFPTMAPASVVHSPFFTAAQHDTYLKFYEVHHGMQLTAQDGGLIAFPSFHVVWGILLAYVCIERKWVFYPIACLNAFLIASTVFLGWHYLIDVIAGAIIAGVSLAIALTLYRKYCSNAKHFLKVDH